MNTKKIILNLASLFAALAATSAMAYERPFTYFSDRCQHDVEALQTVSTSTNGALTFDVSCGGGGLGSNGLEYSGSVTGSYSIRARSGQFTFASDRCQQDVEAILTVNGSDQGRLILNAQCGPGTRGDNGVWYNGSVTGSFTAN